MQVIELWLECCGFLQCTSVSTSPAFRMLQGCLRVTPTSYGVNPLSLGKARGSLPCLSASSEKRQCETTKTRLPAQHLASFHHPALFPACPPPYQGHSLVLRACSCMYIKPCDLFPAQSLLEFSPAGTKCSRQYCGIQLEI